MFTWNRMYRFLTLIFFYSLSFPSLGLEKDMLFGQWAEEPPKDTGCPIIMYQFRADGKRKASGILCSDTTIVAVNYYEKWTLHDKTTISFESIGGDEVYEKLMGETTYHDFYTIVELTKTKMVLKAKETGNVYFFNKVNITSE